MQFFVLFHKQIKIALDQFPYSLSDKSNIASDRINKKELAEQMLNVQARFENAKINLLWSNKIQDIKENQARFKILSKETRWQTVQY